MTGPAIILLVVAILIIWGGLVGAIILLRKVPAPYDLEEQQGEHTANETDSAQH